MVSPAKGHLLDNLLLFSRTLRRLGLDVHTGRVLDAVRVLEDVGVKSRADVRGALRTLFVHRREDLPVFDEAFLAFWRERKQAKSTLDVRSMGEQRRYRSVEASPPPMGRSLSGDLVGDQHAAPGRADRVELTRTFSPREVLQTKEFAAYSRQEMAQALQLMASLRWTPGVRRTRRLERGRGLNLDLRRTLRESSKYGGELLRLRHRRRGEKPLRLVVICDVSGSMEPYTRMMLHFIHTLYGGLESQLEAFLFATRLTRITKHIRHRDIDRAVDDVARVVPDWSGGTRIGAVLREFNYTWARRTLGRGAVVLIVSDGWDRGEPELLGREMARLQRSCRHLIWLNPLAGDERYEPLTQGLRAAMPYVDVLLPAHHLAALTDLANYLNALDVRTSSRRQQRLIEQQDGQLGNPKDREDIQEPPVARLHSSDQSASPSFRHPLWGRKA